MGRVRRRIGDGKLNRLIVAFLKAGVLAEQQFTRTEGGTPQGGILSPVLANSALTAIDERYERHGWPRRAPSLRTEEASGSVVAHILTISVIRRQTVIDVLRELGVSDAETRDPIEWERMIAARG